MTSHTIEFLKRLKFLQMLRKDERVLFEMVWACAKTDYLISKPVRKIESWKERSFQLFL